ncbi:MAG: phosphatidate cytidylyltransferase, partial [Acidobacteriales bacterium]|nr:phosphatidate cytidylyltransferase [Terriglobales bacterium]
WQATYAFVALFFVFVIVASTNRIPLIETTAMIYGLALAAAVAPFVFLAIAMRRGDLTTGYPAAAASVFAFAYVAIPMALLVQIRQQPAGAILVIYTLLVVWAGDIFAYFVGKGLGRHRMSPEISPKKTWEGAIASVVASVIVGMLWFQHAAAISTWLLQVGLIERRDGMFGCHAVRSANGLGVERVAVDAVGPEFVVRNSR